MMCVRQPQFELRGINPRRNCRVYAPSPSSVGYGKGEFLAGRLFNRTNRHDPWLPCVSDEPTPRSILKIGQPGDAIHRAVLPPIRDFPAMLNQQSAAACRRAVSRAWHLV